jgi:hypothetical protein
MPATSIRDLVIHGADVVVGTHGRSFWILDNISPLRQLTPAATAADATLFAPADAYLVKRNVGTDTPLPPDEPTFKNPPDGAVFDYRLKAAAQGPVTLEILDSKKNVVRRYTSADALVAVDPGTLEIDPRWVRPPRPLLATAGSHRFVWDLHYMPLDGSPRRYPISAVYGDTPPTPTSPAVLPGTYTVRLSVGGKTYEQPLTVRLDPRVTTSVQGLEQRFSLSMQCYEGIKGSQAAVSRIRMVRKHLEDVRPKAGDLTAVIDDLNTKLTAIEGTGGGGRGRRPQREATLTATASELSRLLSLLQEADATPTTQVAGAVEAGRKQLEDLLVGWKRLGEMAIPELNAKLKAAGLKEIEIPGK